MRTPVHWADAELLHQAARELEAARELDRRHRDFAPLSTYRDGLILRAAVGGAKEAEIARCRWHHLSRSQKDHRAKPHQGGT